MANQELLIIIGHAWQCLDCRRLLLETPDKALRGRPLTADERKRLTALEAQHFVNLTNLAQMLGVQVNDLNTAMNHARARLRHF
jgi:hypothetical protein